MPTILRSKVALLALLGAFLIPIATSSLRGLTHVLTCREGVRTPFTLFIRDEAPPQMVTSTFMSRSDSPGICGGLSIDLGARVDGRRQLEMVIPITNQSSYIWRGTVKLELDGISIPVGVGAVSAGETETDTVTLTLDEGAHELTGSLLIGP